jgi:hypothetical protein
VVVIRPSNTTPQNVGTSSSAGTANDGYSRVDHIHEGIHSLGINGDTALDGDVTISAGSGIILTRVSQNIEIASSASTTTGGELLMQDGVTAPPVPLETESRDDWVYRE